MTSRLAAGGGYNLAYGLDGLLRLFDDEYLTVRWAQTFEDAPEESGLRAGHIVLEVEAHFMGGLCFVPKSSSGFIQDG